jgi:hypothetical protein
LWGDRGAASFYSAPRSPVSFKAFERKLSELLQKALDRAASKASETRLLDALFDDYREFKRGKKREQWSRVPRNA